MTVVTHEQRVARTIAGESKMAFGYRKVYVPFHPQGRHDGFVFEHRLIAERVAGRFLRSDEIVHHCNENRLDNRAENLEVVTKAQHQAHHMRKCQLTDAEIAELVLLGYTQQRLAKFHVHTHRTARIRRDVLGLPLGLRLDRRAA